MTIAIQICSGAEWRAMKKIFSIKDSQVRPQPYGEFFITPLMGVNCVIYNSRRTKTRAGGACQFAISSWAPKILINLGTCRAISDGLNIGSIILAERTIDFDCIDLVTDEPTEVRTQMESVLDLSWLDWNPPREDFFRGILASADRDPDANTVGELKNDGVLAVDWESSAIAKVAELNGVRCAIVRGVCDFAHAQGDLSHFEQIHKNTPIVIEKAFALLPDALRNVKL